MNRGGGGSGGCGRGDGGDGGGLKLEYQHSGERLKSIEERLRVQEQEMAAAKVDLGEVMHVYDDIQVGKKCVSWTFFLYVMLCVVCRIACTTSIALGRTTFASTESNWTATL